MRFVCLAGTGAENEELRNEYKMAERFGETRLGSTHLFYRYFIKIRYVSYEEIAGAYLREESGESGEFLLKEFYLMIQTKDEALHKLRMERDVNAKEVLNCLRDRYSHISIGFDRLGQSK